jgi:pilus assembly protein TadC
MTPVSASIGLAWGAVVAVAILAAAGRRRVARRARALGVASAVRPFSDTAVLRRTSRRPERRRRSFVARFRATRAARKRERVINADLPVAVDLLGVAVASGCTPYLAVVQTARWAPPSVASPFATISAEAALGRSFAEALADLSSREPALRSVCAVLERSNRLGAPATAALAELGTSLRADARRRAEARARSLSVRLVFPLVFLVLPAFVLLTVAPAVINGLRTAGM